MLTKEDVAKLSTAELIQKFNQLTGQSVKRFSSRAVGEQRVIAAAKAHQSEPIQKQTAPTASPRTVKGAAAAGSAGRPMLDYVIQLTPDAAKSSPHKDSLRQKLIDWLKVRPDNKAHISAIEKHFDRNMRGVVRKLEGVKWIKRLPEQLPIPGTTKTSAPAAASAA